MFNISVERMEGSIFNLKPMSVKRDWMDKTSERHAYRCFPVTQANVIGWSLSCSQDIVFTWDGLNDQTPDHVKISNPASGYGGRGQSSISLDTGLVFKTNSDVSIWTIHPVNYFNDDFETMSNLISTSFYDKPLPLSIRAKKANIETIIKAKTPVATIIPISLTNLDQTSIKITKYSDPSNSRNEANQNYGRAAQEFNSNGKFTDWYRDSVNENKQSLGSHEVKVLRLHVIDDSDKI
jgi:hypothetical protein